MGKQRGKKPSEAESTVPELTAPQPEPIAPAPPPPAHPPDPQELAVTRYDMLQKFRKAVAQGDLSVSTEEIADFGEKVFEVWRSLCQQSVSGDHIWGHPIPLQQIYSRLPFMPWEDFLTALSTVNHAALELVPSRVRNWSVSDILSR